MKIVYAHDDSGFYLGQAYAFESPLEPGVYLLPIGTTEVEPPAPPEGQRPVWSGQSWSLEDLPLPEPEPEQQTQPEPAQLTTVHVAYFRAALASMGQLERVDDLVNQDPVKAQLWGWATTISIHDPSVIQVAQSLNIDLDAVLTKSLEIKAGV